MINKVLYLGEMQLLCEILNNKKLSNQMLIKRKDHIYHNKRKDHANEEERDPVDRSTDHVRSRPIGLGKQLCC